MSRFFFIILTITSLAFWGVSGSFATDLTPKKLSTSPSSVHHKEQVAFTVTVANINQLDAGNFSIRLRLFGGYDSTGLLLYDKTMSGLSIPKYSEQEFTFGDRWLAVFPGYVTCIVDVTFIDDIDLSNNKLTTLLLVDPSTPDEDDAATIIVNYLKAFFPLSDSAREALMMLPDPLPAGTKITSHDSTELNITLSEESWLGWYRNNKYDRYTSVNGVVIMNHKDSTTAYYPTEWWVTVNDTAITQKIVDSMYVYGSPPTVPTIDSTSIHTSQSGTGEAMECAILISGTGTDDREQAAFNGDVDIVSANLRLEKLGPHLKAENIIVLYAPTPTEVTRAFDSLKGKCTKLWFFYSGHGDSVKTSSGDAAFGYMSLGDSSFTYLGLFNNLFASGADEMTVLIDACHSGIAVEELRNDARVKGHNINLITACQTGETSTSFFVGPNYMTGFGAFTLHWFKSFGEPAAEWDGVPGISEQEATDWIRVQNPEFPNGKKMFENFHPRTYFHRVGQEFVEDAPTPMPQTSVTVTLREGEPGKPLSVSLCDPEPASIDAPSQTLTDSSVTGLSYGRKWEFGYTPTIGVKYSFDVEFQIVPGIDSFLNGATPGMLHREDSSKPWSVYTPYEHFPITKTIKAIGVNGFSEWVMASVTKPQAGITPSNATTTSSLIVYPNPSTSTTAIRMTLERTEEIELVLYDALGKACFVAAKGSFPAGEYTMPVSVHTLPAGMYVAHLHSKTRILASSTFQIVR